MAWRFDVVIGEHMLWKMKHIFDGDYGCEERLHKFGITQKLDF